METHLRAQLVLEALDLALWQRGTDAVIHHSDQGTRYTSIQFGARCREAGVRPSMGPVGDCFDNAMCESFFATLECELLARPRFKPRSRRTWRGSSSSRAGTTRIGVTPPPSTISRRLATKDRITYNPLTQNPHPPPKPGKSENCNRHHRGRAGDAQDSAEHMEMISDHRKWTQTTEVARLSCFDFAELTLPARRAVIAGSHPARSSNQ
jgi:putative transposase